MTLPLPTLQRVPTRDGDMLVPRFDRYVSLSLDVYGEYSPDERAALVAFLQPGDIVVQVGANIGALTIPLARAIGPSGHLVCFEPQEFLHRVLSANTLLTNQLHVAAIHAAVGETSGTVNMPRVSYQHPGNFGGISVLEPDADVPSNPVPLVTLDQACKNVPRCALLHIDVEGFEMRVLEGAESFIARTRPVMCIEIDRPFVREALKPWMEARDYVGIEHQPPLYAPENWNGATENIFADTAKTPIVSINCLAIPRERFEELAPRLPQVRVGAFTSIEEPSGENGNR